MRDRLKRVSKWVGYPLFYFFCLFFFMYLTFPFERLRDRIVSEFDKAQNKPGQPSQRLEIDSIDSYWFTGVELTGVRIITPPDPADVRKAKAELEKERKKKPVPGVDPKEQQEAIKKAEQAIPKPSTLTIDEAHGRLPLLSLLTGTIEVDFWASAFTGEIRGTIPIGDGSLNVEFENLELALVTPIKSALGVPLGGQATGKLELEAQEGKFDKASGAFELTVTNASVGDGKTKIADLATLPKASVGTLEVKATATDGNLKIETFNARGPDVELDGEGRITVREPWDNSIADVYVSFKFTDAYRMKDDKTKALLGEPGSPLPPLLESDKKVKRAKKADGGYGFHVTGPLKNVGFNPAPLGSAGGRGGAAAPAPGTKPTTPPALSPRGR